MIYVDNGGDIDKYLITIRKLNQILLPKRNFMFAYLTLNSFIAT